MSDTDGEADRQRCLLAYFISCIRDYAPLYHVVHAQGDVPSGHAYILFCTTPTNLFFFPALIGIYYVMSFGVGDLHVGLSVSSTLF